MLAPNRIVETIASHGGFVHGHTYFSNPFSCAVAAAVLGEVVDQDLVAHARVMGTYLPTVAYTTAAKFEKQGCTAG